MPLLKIGAGRALINAPSAIVGASFVAGAAVSPLNNGFSGGTKTFTALNGSVNFPAGALVIVGVVQDQAATTLTSPTIGGVAATIVSGSQNSGTQSTLYQAVMVSSSADTFSFTNGNAINRMGVASCYMTGMNPTVVAASNQTQAGTVDPQTPSAAITVPAGGFGVAFLAGSNSILNTPNTPVWTSTTVAGGDVNTGGVNWIQACLAHTATAGSWTPTCAGTEDSFSYVAGMSDAVWGP